MIDSKELTSKELDDQKGGDLSENIQMLAPEYFFTENQLVKVDNLTFFEELKGEKGLEHALNICGETLFGAECYETDTYGYNNYHAVCNKESFNKFLETIKEPITKQLTVIQQALDRAVEALKFYAEHKNYDENEAPYEFVESIIYMDGGNKAKAALDSIKE